MIETRRLKNAVIFVQTISRFQLVFSQVFFNYVMLQFAMGRYTQFFQFTFEKFFITAIFAKISNFTVK